MQDVSVISVPPVSYSFTVIGQRVLFNVVNPDRIVLLASKLASMVIIGDSDTSPGACRFGRQSSTTSTLKVLVYIV